MARKLAWVLLWTSCTSFAFAYGRLTGELKAGERYLETDRSLLAAYARRGNGIPTTDELLARLMTVEAPTQVAERGD